MIPTVYDECWQDLYRAACEEQGIKADTPCSVHLWPQMIRGNIWLILKFGQPEDELLHFELPAETDDLMQNEVALSHLALLAARLSPMVRRVGPNNRIVVLTTENYHLWLAPPDAEL